MKESDINEVTRNILSVLSEPKSMRVQNYEYYCFLYPIGAFNIAFREIAKGGTPKNFTPIDCKKTRRLFIELYIAMYDSAYKPVWNKLMLRFPECNSYRIEYVLDMPLSNLEIDSANDNHTPVTADHIFDWNPNILKPLEAHGTWK